MKEVKVKDEKEVIGVNMIDDKKGEENSLKESNKIHEYLEKERIDLNCLKKMFEEEVNMDQKIINDSFALACDNPSTDLEILEYMIDLKCKVNHKHQNGYTALHYACLNDFDHKAEIINFLIEKNADLDAQDILGETPLFLEVSNFESFNIEIIRTLVENKSDVNLENDREMNAFEMITKNDQLDYGFFFFFFFSILFSYF